MAELFVENKLNIIVRVIVGLDSFKRDKNGFNFLASLNPKIPKSRW